jgi:hypothetical protein
VVYRARSPARKTLKDTYFETEWAKDTASSVWNNINYLPLDKCYEFLIGLMSNHGSSSSSVMQINSFGQVQRIESNP